MSGYLRTPLVFHQVSPSVFSPEERYTRMSSSLLSATVQRLLLDRIEASIYSWTVSGDSTNAGMHAHVAAFPYLDVTKISIWQPCLNFAVYSSHILPRRRTGSMCSCLYQWINRSWYWSIIGVDSICRDSADKQYSGVLRPDSKLKTQTEVTVVIPMQKMLS